MAQLWRGRTKSFSSFETNELDEYNLAPPQPTSTSNQSQLETVQSNPNFFRARNSLHTNKYRQLQQQQQQQKLDGLNSSTSKRDAVFIETSFYNDHQGHTGASNLAFQAEDEEASQANQAFQDGQEKIARFAAASRKSVAFDAGPTFNADRVDGFNLDWQRDEEEEKPAWDTFEPFVIEDEDDTIGSYWARLALKIFKILCYVITFALVLSLGVIAKMSFHLMVSMTKIGKTVKTCNRAQSQQLVLVGKLDHDKTYHSVLDSNSPERIVWVWMVFFVLITPEIFSFLKSFKVAVFKKTRRADLLSVMVMFLMATIQVVGVSMFVFALLPSIDSTTGLMFANSIFLLPIVCLCLSRNSSSNSFFKIVYFAALIVQLVTLVAWCIYLSKKTTSPGEFVSGDDVHLVWILPISAIMISIGFCENFIDENTALLGGLSRVKKLSKESKYRIYLYVSLWKCAVYLACMVGIQAILACYHQDWKLNSAWDMSKHLFIDFRTAFTSHNISIVRENTRTPDIITLQSLAWTPIVVALIQIASSFLCYETITFACRVCIQPFGFAMPINLIVPVAVSVMNVLSNIYRNDQCNLVKLSPSLQYIFWNVHYDLFDFRSAHDFMIMVVWFATFIIQCLACKHIWLSSRERLSSTDRLFVLPFYCTAMLDQSMMLSRRIDEESFTITNAEHQRPQHNSETIKIYACATVWHETSSELIAMLKSIMRMDHDQCSRRLAKDYLEADPKETDYYEFETHLFVDDAFKSVKGKQNRYVNEYVELLMSVMNEASSNVYQPCAMVKEPTALDTPYGGRIEWTLPGGNKLIAHLKDKNKIRHRKRWSQVMYMYYLLGFKIYEQETDSNRRKEMTDNTFILALDGDINFRPEAVSLLVDLMRNNSNLGAACGRIHPIGSGPMAWYQKFEYAISHWLQKATEHVFGCVLCSPGCFSLFRATALTETMNRYTTRPTEALHYVQYDQGEDRWLCTLMLQQGWRVEYCAASDAFTHCPESFGEFYIQRRRWAPSTMANILDLLKSYEHTIEKNDNISLPYILYQAGMMVGTILSPGTIFLMLVGATNTAFNLSNEYSFYLNVVPIMFFIFICFFASTEIQILVAQILSTFYAMLMLAVLVSTCIEIQEDTVWSPSVVFFVSMLTIFIVSAIIHPQEFSCLFPSVIYLLTIPSMYLLLTIYSIINLNIVTWGTRETPQAKEEETVPKETAKASQSNWYDVTRYLDGAKKLYFSCLCCASNKNEDELRYLQEIRDSMGKLNFEIGGIKSNIDAQMKLAKVDISHRRRASMYRKSVAFSDQVETHSLLNNQIEEDDEDGDDDEESRVVRLMEQVVNEQERRNSLAVGMASETQQAQSEQAWHETDAFEKAHRRDITWHEKQFWVNFVGKYLKPLVEDKAHQDKVKADLIDLRNKVVFAFAFINVLFVLFVFLLQFHKDMFSFSVRVKHNFVSQEYNETADEYYSKWDDKSIQMDPIGVILIAFFGALLIIQCIGMFMHRFSTFSHLIAFTDLNFFKIKKKDIQDERAMKKKQALDIVHFLLGKECNLAAYEQPKSGVYDMEKNFEDSFINLNPETAKRLERRLNLRRESVNVLAHRRNTLIRRNSLHPNGLLGAGLPFASTLITVDENNDHSSVEGSRHSLNETGWNSFEDDSDTDDNVSSPPDGAKNEITRL